MISLVIVKGSTDRTQLSASHRWQYESNSGLAQARAATIRKCVTDELKSFGADMMKSVQFLILDTGPTYTPPSEPRRGEGNDLQLARDRTVEVVVLGLSDFGE